MEWLKTVKGKVNMRRTQYGEVEMTQKLGSWVNEMLILNGGILKKKWTGGNEHKFHTKYLTYESDICFLNMECKWISSFSWISQLKKRKKQLKTFWVKQFKVPNIEHRISYMKGTLKFICTIKLHILQISTMRLKKVKFFTPKSHIRCNEVSFVCQIINCQDVLIPSLTWKYMHILNAQTRTAAIWGRTKKSSTMVCTMHAAQKEQLSNHCNCHSSAHILHKSPDSSKNSPQRAGLFWTMFRTRQRREETEIIIYHSGQKAQSVRKSDFQSFKGY